MKLKEVTQATTMRALVAARVVCCFYCGARGTTWYLVSQSKDIIRFTAAQEMLGHVSGSEEQATFIQGNWGSPF
jgi:hypothetical protein